MKIGFGCDYTGIQLKNALIAHLTAKGYECIDYGGYDPAAKTGYAESGLKVAEAIKAGECEKGVLICGTGVGISLCANKVPGIRAAVCSEPYTARMTAMHNDSHIIAMGSRVVGEEMAKMIVDEFFGTPFEGGRHIARLELIKDIERKYGYADK